MKNSKKYSKFVLIGLVFLIILQLLLIFTDTTQIDLAKEKAKTELNTTNKIDILNRAEKIREEEIINLIRASKIRNFIYNLDESDRLLLIESRTDSIKKFKNENPNKAKKAQNELNIIENGYSPISFIMEKVFYLTSIEFMEHQNQYFFLILTTIIFIALIIINLITKNKLSTNV